MGNEIDDFHHLVCDDCGKDAFTIDEPAEGWLILTSLVTNQSVSLNHHYCPECRDELLSLIGYESYKNYVSVVKAHSELERSLEARAMNEGEVPFFLIEEMEYDLS